MGMGKSRLLLLIVALVCTSCGVTYQYGGVTYKSKSGALSAAHADIDATVDGVTPVDQSLDASVIVLRPEFQTIKKYGVVSTGEPNEEVVNYIARTIDLGMEGVGRSIVRSNVFSSTKQGTAPDPRSASFDGNDFKVYLDATGFNEFQWYLEANGNDHRVPLYFPAGAPRDKRGDLIVKTVVDALGEFGIQ